jgi:hypothetical protein
MKTVAEDRSSGKYSIAKLLQKPCTVESIAEYSPRDRCGEKAY